MITEEGFQGANYPCLIIPASSSASMLQIKIKISKQLALPYQPFPANCHLHLKPVVFVGKATFHLQVTLKGHVFPVGTLTLALIGVLIKYMFK